jgi:hypothetical protein
MTSTTATARTRPRRAVQLVIWLLFAGALLGGVKVSDYSHADSLPAQQQSVSVLASGTGLASATLADAPAAGSTVPLLRQTYGVAAGGVQDSDRPLGLLPAYRWRNALSMPTDLGWFDSGNADNFLAELMFGVASFIWQVVLTVVQYAMSMNIVTQLGVHINGLFASAASGLTDAGIPLVAGVVIAAIAALRAFRGKLNESIRIGVTGFLVLGALSFFTVAAGHNQTGAVAAGSPAWVATQGNLYVDDIGSDIATAFGTASNVDGSAQLAATTGGGDSGGATCTEYNAQLYGTYDTLSGADTTTTPLAASSMSMVSYLWQRSLYDNYTIALFGDLGDGSRMTCHQLEKNANIDPLEQFAVVGGTGPNATATSGAYAGMHIGPFYSITHNKKNDEASIFAWAACGGTDGQQPRPGWNSAGAVTSSNCVKWYGAEAPKASFWTGSYGSAINAGSTNGNVLEWNSSDALAASTAPDASGGCSDPTTGTTMPASQCTAQDLDTVQTVVSSYYGHDGANRIVSAMFAIVSASLYSYAFGGTALGTILTQFGLVIFLGLLPYTLLLLAFPSKNGSRSGLGKKMLKITSTFFAGKLAFLVLLGVTLETMSLLFSLTISGGGGTSAAGTILAAGSSGTGSASSYTLWSLVIPLATIIIIRLLMKTLGLGNIMSVGGALGFATSAVNHHRDGKALQSKTQGHLKGTLSAARKVPGVAAGLGSGAGKLAGDSRAGRMARAARLRRAVDGDRLSPELAAKVAAGTLTRSQAKKQQTESRKRAAMAELDPELQDAVLAGRLTRGQAGKHQESADAINGRNERSAAAERMERARNTPLSGEDRGTAAALDRVAARSGALAAARSETPPFVLPLPGAGSRSDISADKTMRRQVLKLQTKGMGKADQYLAVNGGGLSSELAQLAAVSRVDGSTEPLTGAGLGAAVDAASELLGGDRSLVLAGSSGAPMLIQAAQRRDGKVLFDQSISDFDVQAALVGNPLNLLDEKVVAQLPGENADRYHARMTLTLLEAGLIDPNTGAIVDVIKEMGLDRGNTADRQEIVRIYKGETDRLQTQQVALSAESSDRVKWTLDQVMPAVEMHGSVGGALEIRRDQVLSLASQASFDAAQVQRDIVSQLNGALHQPAGSVEFQRAVESALREVERQVPAAVLAAQAVTIDLASVAAGSADTAEVDVMLRAARSQADEIEAHVHDLESQIAHQVAAIKVAPAGIQQDLLRSLAETVQSTLDSAHQDVEDQVRNTDRAVSAALQSLRMAAAAQARQEQSSTDYADHASDLPPETEVSRGDRSSTPRLPL